MDKFLRFFRPILTISYKYPYAVIIFIIITGAVGGYFAQQLKINTDLSNLLPKKNPHVQALHKLQKTVGGESSMTVVIQSPSFKDNLRFAKSFIHKSLQLYDSHRDAPYFDHGSYKREVDVLKNNALYFATTKELDEIINYLQDQVNEVNKKANPFLIDFSADDKPDTSEKKLERFQETYNDLIPSEYAISKDSTVMLVHLMPSGTKTDLAYLSRLFSNVDSLITAMNPASYNPEMKLYYANRLWSHLQQFNSIRHDVFSSFSSGISSVILLVMLYFFIKKYIKYRRRAKEDQIHSFWQHVIRMPVSAFVIGFPLLISLAWTFALAYFVLGSLNTMTSVLFVILFGIANAYGIHFYGRYIDFRSEGLSVKDAIYRTYDKTGSAIIISGSTTALSLYILLLSGFRGFSEFGFIAGTGVVLGLFCMLYVLPALLVIFDRWNWILVNPKNPEKVASTKRRRFPFPGIWVAVVIIIVVAVIINRNNLHFQYDFGELQPTFKKSLVYDSVAALAGRGHKRNPAYLLADSRKQVQEIAATLRHRMHSDTTSPTILDVEALPERFPKTPEQIHTKLQKIAQVRKLLNKPVIKNKESNQLDELRRASQTVEPVSLSDIPDFFKSKFTDKNGQVGNFVIVYPSVTLADSRNSVDFMNDVGVVKLDNGKKVYAASTSIIGAEIITLLQNESPWLIGGTFFMILLISLFSYRSLKWALLAMMPLIIGFVFMFGVMMLIGMKLNLYNLIILPAILGIGEDNGVHVVSRYLKEGSGSIWEVLTSTGQHVIIASGTAMLGFSGLLFTTHPGLHSMGAVADLGKGMTLLAALIFLPALIQWLEDRGWMLK